MECSETYISRFAEIKVLAELAKADSGPDGNISRANAITRSGIVLLCGYFEGFLREMCKEFIDKINDLEINAKSLPISLLSEHSIYCLEKYKQNKLSLFTDFITGLTEQKPIDLDSDKLSETNANPTVDNIERLFQAFDMPLILDELSIQDFGYDSMYNNVSQLTTGIIEAINSISDGDVAKEQLLTEAIEGKWRPKVKRRRIGYLNVVDELLKKRNRIAHGEGFEIITFTDLDETADLIIALCTKLVAKLEAKLSAISP